MLVVVTMLDVEDFERDDGRRTSEAMGAALLGDLDITTTEVSLKGMLLQVIALPRSCQCRQNSEGWGATRRC